jgi:zinc transporter ZupT
VCELILHAIIHSLVVLGAAAGGFLATTLAESPVLFAGMLSFGTSALLFMVAEELLLEAHEDGEHVWWVDLQLYVGFYASVMLGKFVT